MIRRLQPWLLLGTGLLAMPVSVFAAAAGQVMFVSGEVTAERQPPVSLVKGDDVLVADTVRTGPAARAQLLLQDGARLAIRPGSAIRIEEYVYQAASSAAPAASRSANRSVTRLLKGGLRTITGAIGKADQKAYEVRTPVGVLGIRGTDYMAVFCNADCRPSGSGTALAEDGLYLGVIEGGIVFSNETGSIELRSGEHAFVPLDTRRPRRLAAPPAVFTDEFERPVVGQLRPSPVGFDSRLGSRRQPEVNAAPNDDSEMNNTGTERADAPKQPLFGTDAEGNRIDLLPGQIQDVRPSPGDNTDIYQ